MKRYVLKITIAILVFFLAGLFFAIPASSIILRIVNPPKCPKQVWKGDYTINSDDDLEALSGYTHVIGNLSIRGVTDLTGLECLKKINGNLLIVWDEMMKSVKGLDYLASVDGDLTIEILRFGEDLNGLNGLNKVQRVGGDLKITLEDEDLIQVSLKAINGLRNLTHVAGNLKLIGNITRFESFSRLQYVNGTLEIGFNGSAENLRGFRSLKMVGRDLMLKNIESGNVTSLNGFDKLHRIGGSLLIDKCVSLNDLSGLNRLRSIGVSLKIVDNWNLSSLDGLGSLENAGGDFRIEDNKELCTGFAEALRDQIYPVGRFHGAVEINHNKECGM